ncbi:unnamed protein product [Owenia fusiformis]|uniref:Uncharacterized protein n=1 Tax=Owenia fusiformis TaxID=6347 RepID=A0A8J1XSD1_OWEFU|nr:unnamed protein product [Owenia fusiformis]
MMIVLYLLGCVTLTGVYASPNGAPITACVNMHPNHGIGPQNSTSPFQVHSTLTKYKPNQRITVQLRGPRQFRGVLLQARVQSGNPTTPVGTFHMDGQPARDLKTLTCTARDDAVTHSNRNLKGNIEVVWTAPNRNFGNIQFVATFVESKTRYWMNVKSAPVSGSMETVILSLPLLLVTALSSVLYTRCHMPAHAPQ